MYQLYANHEITGLPIQAIKRISDGAGIPFDLGNTDYQTYLKWLDGYEQQFNKETEKMEWIKTSNGNTPLPADE
jgi:hypothetical protein